MEPDLRHANPIGLTPPQKELQQRQWLAHQQKNTDGPRGCGTDGVPERETADNWQQYAKEGETAQACIERHRREQDSLLKLLAQAREPLTDQQIISLVPAGWTGMLTQVMEFARRIERARTDGVKTGGGTDGR